MKNLREELVSLAAVIAVPLGFAAVFPRAAIGFSASDGDVASGPSASVVFLDSDSVVRAMRSARILSKHEGGGDASVADLLSAELPGADVSPVMPIGSRVRAPAPTVVEGGIPPFLPSRRAAAPVRIRGGKNVDALPFPRTELLKLN